MVTAVIQLSPHAKHSFVQTTTAGVHFCTQSVDGVVSVDCQLLLPQVMGLTFHPNVSVPTVVAVVIVSTVIAVVGTVYKLLLICQQLFLL